MRVYLDNNATTPVDPAVVEAIVHTCRHVYGNPSSNHAWGWSAMEHVEMAREQLATFLNCEPSEIVFTSGATESINTALRSFAGRNLIFVSSKTDHKAVLNVLKNLRASGEEVYELDVDQTGRIRLEKLREVLSKGEGLLSIIGGNNEIGTIEDIALISQMAKDAGWFVHLDAVQLIATHRLDLSNSAIDLASFSAHKIYGPKGAGALFVKDSIRQYVRPLIDGAGQERGLRSGTYNTEGIVGFGKAVEILNERLDSDNDHKRRLLEVFLNELQGLGVHYTMNGDPEQRIAGNLSLTLPAPAEYIISRLAGEIALSAGSACASMSGTPSHVLQAIGLSAEDIKHTIRIGIGRFNTEDEMLYSARRIASLVDEYKNG